MKRFELLIPPPLVMLITGLLMWLLARIFPMLSFAWLHNGTAASVVAVLGLLISLAGVIAFRRAQTTTDPRHPGEATSLLTTGIYRYSRNPMYLGVLLVLVGWAINLGNLLGLACALVFIAYITRFQIIPEERMLQEKFGAGFEAYRRAVRRWV